MPERKCESCTRQKEWGCEAKRWRHPKPGEPDGPENWVKPAYLPVTLDGEETWACPRQHLRENPHYWAKILKLYGMYRKGFLPDKGAVVDQSNRAIEIFQILDDANAQCDQEESRRDSMKRNREARSPRPAR